MKSETATQGKITKMVFGADAIEIKATIPDAHIEHTLSRFNLTLDNDEERYIYFFDTPSLDLLKAGIIARTRRMVGCWNACTDCIKAPRVMLPTI